MYYFIINPQSRSGAGLAIWQKLQQELLSRKITFQYDLTKCVGHATELARRATRDLSPNEPLRLIAVGGDGTIHEVLSGICDFSCVIFGYIPTGSGNDFCRSLKLPSDPMQALHSILAEKRIMEMDVPCILDRKNRTNFGISTGIGYDAAVCQEVLTSPAKKTLNKLKLGKLVYLVIALKQLFFSEQNPMELCLDDKQKLHFDRVYFTAVMNQKYEGGGFKFCPAARPDDHILDVITVEGLPKLKLLLCLPTAFFGLHTHVRGIHLYQCHKIEIRSAVPLPVHKDGEFGGLHRNLSVSLEKKTLKIILPVL